MQPVKDVLNFVHATAPEQVTVSRIPAVAGGPNAAEAMKRAEELARNPQWCAETEHGWLLIDRDTAASLLALGAKDDHSGLVVER